MQGNKAKYVRGSKVNLRINNTLRGECLYKRITELMTTGEGVDGTEPLTYSDEYLQGADIRTDKWEVAIEAMKKGDIITKREKDEMIRQGMLKEQQEKEQLELEEKNEFNKKVEEVIKKALGGDKNE